MHYSYRPEADRKCTGELVLNCINMTSDANSRIAVNYRLHCTCFDVDIPSFPFSWLLILQWLLVGIGQCILMLGRYTYGYSDTSDVMQLV